jgi:hypothetical protein
VTACFVPSLRPLCVCWLWLWCALPLVTHQVKDLQALAPSGTLRLPCEMSSVTTKTTVAADGSTTTTTTTVTEAAPKPITGTKQETTAACYCGKVLTVCAYNYASDCCMYPIVCGGAPPRPATLISPGRALRGEHIRVA